MLASFKFLFQHQIPNSTTDSQLRSRLLHLGRWEFPRACNNTFAAARRLATTELDLRDGRVTDTGVLALCALLKANTALRRLNLERNGLLDSSLALTSLLRENHTLRQLQLTARGSPPCLACVACTCTTCRAHVHHLWCARATFVTCACATCLVRAPMYRVHVQHVSHTCAMCCVHVNQRVCAPPPLKLSPQEAVTFVMFGHTPADLS